MTHSVCDIPNDKLQIIIQSAVEAVMKHGGHISIQIVGEYAEIDIYNVDVATKLLDDINPVT